MSICRKSVQAGILMRKILCGWLADFRSLNDYKRVMQAKYANFPRYAQIVVFFFKAGQISFVD